MNNYYLIALVGESGSGKDTVLKKTVYEYPELFHRVVNHTTRPIRQGEQDGVDYHFVDEQEYSNLVTSDAMLEVTCFNDWFYGTSVTELVPDKINIGVFNPSSVDQLRLDKRVQVYVFYVESTEKERLLRQLTREENPDCHEIIRRFKTDWIDFEDIDELADAFLENHSYADLEKAPHVLGSFAKTVANLDKI